MLSRIARHAGLLRTLGAAEWLRYHRALRAANRSGNRFDEVALRPRCAQNAVWLRTGTSDHNVFNQVFVKQEYAAALKGPQPDVVIDCGANVGYASAFFLNALPDARVIAVEPCPDNYAQLTRNLSCYGERARPLQAAVWPEQAQLTMADDRYRDGREWTRQVRACEPGEAADVHVATLPLLLEGVRPGERVLLKIDIEGAEVPLFEGDVSWLDKIDDIAIELHDDSAFGRATPTFMAAIDGYGYSCSRAGELTLCSRTPEASESVSG